MSIQDAVTTKQANINATKRCKVSREIQSMGSGDYEAAIHAVELCRDDPQHYSSAWFTKVLNDNGYPVGKTAVSDHLAGRCTCDRSQ